MMRSMLFSAAIAVLLSANGAEAVRSVLYPADWKPGFADAEGNWLPDFSYAGYHQGRKTLPASHKIFADVTRPPYLADPTGIREAAAAVQKALDEAGRAGGGVVYLPPGTYRLKFPEGADAALRIRHSKVILRGAGPEKTRLFLDETESRGKNMILVRPDADIWWFSEQPQFTTVTADLLRPTHDIPVASTEGFRAGDTVLLRNTVTEEFIAEHGMTGKWHPGDRQLRGVLLPRRITAVDAAKKVIRLDAPTFYEMKVRDRTRLSKIADRSLQEVGVEELSLGMRENPEIPDWTARDPVDTAFTKPENGAYHIHASAALRFMYCENGFIRHVNSYRPEGNRKIHIHSNGIRLDYSRQITVTGCDWHNPQYRGGGGNGYLYTLNCNDSVIRDSSATNGRHNFDFQNMHTAGNVVYNCTIRDGAIPSDFHMYLSTGNLIDSVTCDGDYWECRFRPYGGKVMHGQGGAGNVFWNLRGERYPANRKFIVDSQQARRGMVIGTGGSAFKASWKSSGLRELIGRGDRLEPQSLWLDQVNRRDQREAAEDRKKQ